MKRHEIKKPIILMCVAALLIAVLIIIAGVTYSISSRSTSPLFNCINSFGGDAEDWAFKVCAQKYKLKR